VTSGSGLENHKRVTSDGIRVTDKADS